MAADNRGAASLVFLAAAGSSVFKGLESENASEQNTEKRNFRYALH
jgi:hypothetical protein